MRAAFPGQMDKLTLPTGLTAGTWMCSDDFSMLVAPDIEGKQGPAQLVSGANQKLDGLGGLDGANQIDRAVEDTGGVTGFDRAFGRSGKDAGQAGGFTGENVHGHGVGGDGGSVNPRLAVLHGEIVDEIASFKIVGCIEDEIGIGSGTPCGGSDIPDANRTFEPVSSQKFFDDAFGGVLDTKTAPAQGGWRISAESDVDTMPVPVTLVPVLCTFLVRGPFHSENRNWVMRILLAIYDPVLDWALRCRKTVLALAATLLAFCCLLAFGLPRPVLDRLSTLSPQLSTRLSGFGSEFMPTLQEGSLLFMPVLLRRIKPWQVIVIALGVDGSSYALFPLAAGVPQLTVLSFVLGLGLGCAQPVIMSML